MYCGKGNEVGVDNNNANIVSRPMFNARILTRRDWWFQHYAGCDQFPPPAGEVLEIPSGGEFTVELANNRAFTTRSGHPVLGIYPNGKDEITSDGISEEGCIFEPNIHTKSELEAAGTAFAISYANDFEQVTPENLVVFSVLYHTPYRRLSTYQAPNLPQCPPGGCTCAWGWLTSDCGRPDFYMQAFKCTVTNPDLTISPTTISPAQPPVWCEDDLTKCIKGPKQMIYFLQLDGNNVEVDGVDRDGKQKKPGCDATDLVGSNKK
ncbi:hypothetical protein FA15DRAFT_723035 [Coprinopsis marcescibilis]|uniref:Uncharacterized protein n=1 Tax=Coprinopsis marcescibilis TaxID=230819 RepID=A0A5C3L4F7_COPMA|nr:hypothetical protein FA15DRAFT_723035 [Coprinopsis marcescibilis]